MKINMLLNVCLLIPPCVLGIYYPDVGSLAAYMGSFSCFFVIYTMPTLTYMKIKKTSVHNPGLAEAIISDKFELRSSALMVEAEGGPQQQFVTSPRSMKSSANSSMSIASPNLQRAIR